MGIVERFGPQLINGWVVPSRTDEPVTVTLNGVTVSQTFPGRAVNIDGASRDYGFQFKLGGLWEFLGPEDAVEVRYDGVALPIVGTGFRYFKPDAGASRAQELIDKTLEGFIFDKWGKLHRSIRENRVWQNRVFALFDKVNEVVRDNFGRELTITYGTLLGCVREGDFIESDDDLDTVFLCEARDPAGVQAEFKRLCEVLIDNGFRLMVGGRLHQHYLVKVSAPDSKTQFDIFFAWFNEHGAYQISYGYHGPEAHEGPGFELETRQLGRRRVRVPRDSEALVRQLFGETWGTPDQGFDHNAGKSRKIDRDYFLGIDDGIDLYWREFYRDNDPQGPSPFAVLVGGSLTPGTLVLDVGCGNGRDAAAFAAAGHTVFACDASPVAIARAQASCAGLDNCVLAKVDVGNTAAMRAYLDHPSFADALDASTAVLAYMRLLPNAVTPETEQALLSVLADRLPIGARLAAEFRTDKDQNLPKAFWRKHYRRFIPPDEFVARLTGDYGFTVESRQDGLGFSPFGREDPHLCRLIAVKAPAAARKRPGLLNLFRRT